MASSLHRSNFAGITPHNPVIRIKHFPAAIITRALPWILYCSGYACNPFISLASVLNIFFGSTGALDSPLDKLRPIRNY